jgi:hypothetical protein
LVEPAAGSFAGSRSNSKLGFVLAVAVFPPASRCEHPTPICRWHVDMIDIGRFNSLTAAGILPMTARDVLSGKISEAEALEAAGHRRAAGAVLAQAPADRPRPSLAWDLGANNWFRSMDGCDPVTFAAGFPQLGIFSVDRHELMAALSPHTRRRSGPWSEPYRSKTAGLVAYLVSGGKVTPPHIILVSDGLALAGGHHRLGWAHFRRVRKLPILLARKDLPAVARRLPSVLDDGGAYAISP